MPRDGYTLMFQKILRHDKISVQLATKVEDVLEFCDVEHAMYDSN